MVSVLLCRTCLFYARKQWLLLKLLDEAKSRTKFVFPNCQNMLNDSFRRSVGNSVEVKLYIELDEAASPALKAFLLENG